MDTPAPGQRWVSDTEPELGLGVVLKAGYGRVEIFFPAASEHRQYAIQVAPLRRVRFSVGDTIKCQDNTQHTVTEISEDNALLVYHTEKTPIPEALLSDTISFSKPQDRLMAGQIEENHVFELRLQALEKRCAMRQSPARGFIGARADLIPHQMAIASEVTTRLLPRVLLADEVGLGKTIEACLILHRLHLTGRASRVLILVPDPLLHQWFIELLRRFNLMFSLFDEERCTAIEQQNAEHSNPFLDSQLILTSISLLTDNPHRLQQALDASWDLLIVDEAHHLEWQQEAPSAAYLTIEKLATHTPGLLLLSATPQQLGSDGHFARLRLLDPDRYSDLPHFITETQHYEQVAAAIDRVLDTGKLNATDRKLFASRSSRVQQHFDALKKGDETARQQLVKDLIDEFGTGRVMFRNTRRILTGFPQRKVHLIPLPAAKSIQNPPPGLIQWLADLIRSLPDQKILAICRTAELASNVQTQLAELINIHTELFHENLSLLQRDRHAASFAEPDGARLLICSEIGSEGRNFQFAHHLVLLDLPPSAELLEQRIGRLDRIGQTSTINIHVPFIQGSPTEAWAQWFHQGINAFENTVHGAAEIQKQFAADTAKFDSKITPKALQTLIKKTATAYQKLQSKLARGKDRLLELSSQPTDSVFQLIQSIQQMDASRDFEHFFIEVLDFFGLHIEHLTERDYFIHHGHLITDAFPAMPEEGLAVTFDRQRALTREQLTFLTPDHPLVRGALDLLLGGEHGNITYTIWHNAETDGLLLEAIFIAETVAPAHLHSDRFLPATPIRVLVNHAFKNVTTKIDLSNAQLRKGRPEKLMGQAPVRNKIFPKMLRRAEEIAKKRSTELATTAATAMQSQLQEEITRLTDLRSINDHIREEEITALQTQQDALTEAITNPQLRLDAIRLIWCTTQAPAER